MQGRFKRDGTAPAEQEPRGGTDRGSSPQRAQNPGPAAAGDSGDRTQRSGTTSGSDAETPTPSTAAGPNSTGSRLALRNWRISTRLVSLLALPVVAATTLGGMRINQSMNDMDQLEHMQILTEMTKQATALANALQEERDKSAGPLSNGVKATDFKVTDPRKRTDRAKDAFFEATDKIGNTPGDEALDSIHTSVSQIGNQLGQIISIRKDAYAEGAPSLNTVDRYSQLINSLLSLSQDMAQATSNPDMIKRTRALAAFSASKEYASVQRAIIAAALPGGDGSKADLDENDKTFGRNALSKEDLTRKTFEATYASTGADATELLASLDNGNPEITSADMYAKKVLDSPLGMQGSAARTYMDWYDQSSNKIQAMKTIEASLLGEMETKARELREESQRDALINGAVILIVLGVSLVGAFVVARSMIRSLRRLQDTATRVAQDRLPELVRQLSETDPQDVDTSVESVGVHSRDEIGQVAAAFDDVHREAVRLAAEQALLRGNVNAMFTNLSRRSQGLIQRQLSLISELEAREADPDQLSSLFKLDHLATRMRRNGENLLVLAGEEPGRRWTRPVPLVDVLRAAASEVEQYERIELAAVPATEVAGRIVNDLVHLLAELLENATSFSPPQTKVRVTGHALPDGRVLVEIHDTGIGLSPEDLAAINERLASPPTVDVSVSRRMGLFVVGRLSLRHGIRIQLRPSDSGGTTALVMLPMEVAHGGKQPPSKQGQQPGAPGGLLAGGGAPGGQRPGPGGSPAAPAKGLGSGSGPRGQVGAGSGPRAALPSRDGGPRQPQQPGAGFPGPGGQQAPGLPSQGRPEGPRQGGGLSGAFGGARMGARGQQDSAGTDPSRPNLFGHSGPGQPGQQSGPPARQAPQPQQAQHGQGDQGGFQQPGRQLPPTGAPRAELPGGNPQQQRPQNTSWGVEEQAAPGYTPLDAPRGHEEPDSGRFARPGTSAPHQPFDAPHQRPPMNDRQGPAATSEFARPDFSAPQAPQAPDPASTAQFARPDYDAPLPQDQGYGAQPPQYQQMPAPRQRDNADFGAPLPPAPAGGELQQRPALPQQHEALPPAGPGDGRTPLYDTLETNWFHGVQQGGQPPAAEQPQAPAAPEAADTPAPPMPRRGAADTAPTSSWRTSPNDELVRQAERVKKPAAGGITTSGLPRRVPRANLVPGTAQQQNHQSGPQVSRAPDDVRGRLTNLRRGIQQGRQANNGPSTGSIHLGPTHQQER
ncbi:MULTISPECIES: sensor histidine kinase [Streptomyces]|uniref:histidine kinase n=1 Tax=Streptomyces clavifer TaxID=68188 RepID=A0ABS4V4J6_9ACTN|nr:MULTISPECIES: nitrate- and nitrite sensing domain-containing protein [Streptomyces]MBP2358834.1 signal transduction histidine kinase [Streptomyces clavifer]MDX2747580.1 nitrate- and nitrite sensing domain-containing protein [Streptomyces sp. NRRL_B-2557]